MLVVSATSSAFGLFVFCLFFVFCCWVFVFVVVFVCVFCCCWFVWVFFLVFFFGGGVVGCLLASVTSQQHACFSGTDLPG